MSAIPAPAARLAGPARCRAGFTAGDDEQALLARYAQGEVGVRGTLAERYMPMARRLAARHRNSGEAREDLEQVAFVGLLKAIDRYDPDLGSFIGYAVPSIRGELKRHFRDKGWGMRVPRALQERWITVSAASETLSGRLGRSPTPKDIAHQTGLSLDEVLEALEASAAYSPRALDAPMALDDDAGRTLGDSVGAEDAGFEMVELAQAIGPAFHDLPEREQQILRLRFVEDLTQLEIAGRVGISQMHVSRLLRRSVRELSRATGE
ncbi:MAG: SigB/SigF/SigG family RNA polymerase sigma factor [Thermoleophilaceae bacterium]